LRTAAPAGTDVDADAGPAADRSSRLALGAFVAVLIGAFVFYVVVGRKYWFSVDDWNLLVTRQGGGVDGLFQQQHDHWITIPIVAYRVLWRLFGLNYTAYLVPVVVLHLVAAVLLRIIMRRAGVRPWIATVVAAAVVLLGVSGWNNIVWSFQICFTGALVCGLAHLLLADHDGPFDRRDGFGLLFGVAALMFSGVGVAMAFMVGLAVLIRRGWRLAAIHVAPLAAVFVVWYLQFGGGESEDSKGELTIGDVVRFTGRGVFNSLDRMTRLPGGGIALSVVLLVGLALAWRGLPHAELRKRLAAPAALLAGVPVFLVIVGIGRGAALTSEYATISRFVHVVAVLSAPAIAVALDALGRRWLLIAAVVGAVLVFGMARNVDGLWVDHPGTTTQEAEVRAIVSVPAFDRVPDSVHPFPELIGPSQITVGWLRAGVASGRIDPLEHIDEPAAAAATLRLALEQRHVRIGGDCHPMRKGVRTLEAGDRIDFIGAFLVELITKDGVRSPIVAYGHIRGKRVVAMTGPLKLDIAPYTASTLECR
jgi:hypothetical protein